MMTHEPECWFITRANQPDHICICGPLRAAYRRGYNDHARSAAHWQATHGAYREPYKPCGCDASLYCSVCEPAKWKASQ